MASDAAPNSEPTPVIVIPGSMQEGGRTSSERPKVHIVDTPETRVHRLADLIALLAAVLGVVIVLVVGAYAHGTTQGITEDVRGISAVLQRLLVAPVNVFSGLVTIVVPITVLIDLALRKEPRRMLEVLGASVVGFGLTVASVYLIQGYGPDELVQSVTVGSGVEAEIALPAYIAGVAAMLTTAGMRSTRRALGISWNLLWAAIAVAIISGIVTLPAGLATILVGRAAGLAFRYALGSTADRAYGMALVEGIRRAGIEPKSLIRADASGTYVPKGVDEVSTALGRTRHGRVYALTTQEKHQLIMVALDGDQHAAGLLTKLWSSLRFRGINARADLSLRHSAEATALVSHAARGAGVRTARVLGMAQARDTMILIYQRPQAARPLTDLNPDDVTDLAIDLIWAEVTKAHQAGISHRSISADTVLMGTDDYSGIPTVWLTSWELGETATSELAKRFDRAQLVAMLAAVVGPQRAIDSAFRALGADGVERFAPLLQSIALPRSTRTALRAASVTVASLRKEILERLPDADVEPEKITRFGWRTVMTLALGIVAVGIIFATFNTEQVLAALRDANPWWLLVAFAWVLVTFVGAAVSLLAFSPVKVPWWRAILAQVAAAYLAIAAPAGVGPAALNLRLLTKRGAPAPLAVATVALVQVSGVVVTALGLVVLSLVTGSQGTLVTLPSGSVLVGAAVTAALVAVSLVVPKVRNFAFKRLRPMVRQTWPRLAQVLGQPWRLGLGMFGNVLLTVAYVGAFDAVLKAFGQHIPVIDATILFLLGNAAGAVVPTPGGLGAVEAALGTGLKSSGMDTAVAASVVASYRLLSYWARIPLGYVAMRYMQRKGEL